MHINGVTVKSLNSFIGHEGEKLYQGNLYIGNKKIGFWTQNDFGNYIDTVVMENGYSEKLLRKAIISRNKDKEKTHKRADGSTFTIEYDLENLMYDAITLKEDEKQFKKGLKNGYPITVAVAGPYIASYMQFNEKFNDLTDDELINDVECQKMIKEVEEESPSNGLTGKVDMKITVYRSLDDFNIGDPIKLEEIKK